MNAPPTSRTGPAPHSVPKWVGILADVRAADGEWCELPGDFARSTAHNITHGVFAGLEPGEYEATGRAHEKPGRCRVFVRFVGERG